MVSKNPIDIKAGNFISEIREIRSYITRSLDKQVELISEIDYDLELSIKWLNDFEYELTYLGSSTGYDFFKLGSKFHVRVKNVSDGGYAYLVRSNFFPRDKVIKGYYKKID